MPEVFVEVPIQTSQIIAVEVDDPTDLEEIREKLDVSDIDWTNVAERVGDILTYWTPNHDNIVDGHEVYNGIGAFDLRLCSLLKAKELHVEENDGKMLVTNRDKVLFETEKTDDPWTWRMKIRDFLIGVN